MGGASRPAVSAGPRSPAGASRPAVPGSFTRVQHRRTSAHTQTSARAHTQQVGQSLRRSKRNTARPCPCRVIAERHTARPCPCRAIAEWTHCRVAKAGRNREGFAQHAPRRLGRQLAGQMDLAVEIRPGRCGTEPTREPVTSCLGVPAPSTQKPEAKGPATRRKFRRGETVSPESFRTPTGTLTRRSADVSGKTRSLVWERLNGPSAGAGGEAHYHGIATEELRYGYAGYAGDANRCRPG